jgi:hypothetical protein
VLTLLSAQSLSDSNFPEAALLVLRVCHHEIIPGKPWSILQLQHALRLRVMTNQIAHKVKVTMGKTRKAA